MGDLYELLGIKKDATPKDIKKAYHKMSKIHHPDKGGDEEKMKEISEAYRILSNPDLREMYDNGGSLEELQEEADGLMRRVFAVFEETINDFGFVPDHTDLFKRMREKCNEKEIKMNKDIETLEGEIRNVKAIQNRMKNADIFKRYLDGINDATTHKIKGIEKEIEYIGRILTFIENCEYEYEEDDEDVLGVGSANKVTEDHINNRGFGGFW